MRITPEHRTATILRVRGQIARGLSLADACAVERVKATTFISWMRRFGRDGNGGAGYPTSITRRALLAGWSEHQTLGGMGTSFAARVRTRVFADFSPTRGIALVVVESSPSAWIGDGCRRTEDTIAESLRSITEIRDAAKALVDSADGLDKIAERARAAFPWLPERIEA